MAALAVSVDVSVIGPQEGITAAAEECFPPQLPSSAAEECHDCDLLPPPAADLEADKNGGLGPIQ